MNFDKAFDIVVGVEKGLSNNKYDPGGMTKFGISKKTYPDVDIENLTIEQAKDIYKRDFWDAMKIDGYPYILRLMMFDTAVNGGQKEAVKLLQQAVGVYADGIIGPTTLNALDIKDPNQVLGDYGFYRYDFYKSLDTFSHFGEGWVHRIMTILSLSQTE